MFTDYYAEQSCTAGRSSFITGQCTLRTGLSKVGHSMARPRSANERRNAGRTAQAARLCHRTNLARTTSSTATSSCRLCMASMNSMAISIDLKRPRRTRSRAPIRRDPAFPPSPCSARRAGVARCRTRDESKRSSRAGARSAGRPSRTRPAHQEANGDGRRRNLRCCL